MRLSWRSSARVADEDLHPEDMAIRAEVERRLDRPFSEVQDLLVEWFGRPWDEVEVSISTSAEKRSASEADVIVHLITKAERKPPPAQAVKRRLITWIGKPWRERENPWDRFKDRIPEPPSREQLDADDLEEWTPLKPEED